MRGFKLLSGFLLASAALVAPVSASFAEQETGSYPVAGLEPAKRPQGAPTITNNDKGKEWLAQSLTGVTKPYPDTLRFLYSQGGWYTPFDHPGMVGRYDLRSWHKKKAVAKAE
jgi:hypothetical protein